MRRPASPFVCWPRRPPPPLPLLRRLGGEEMRRVMALRPSAEGTWAIRADNPPLRRGPAAAPGAARPSTDLSLGDACAAHRRHCRRHDPGVPRAVELPGGFLVHVPARPVPALGGGCVGHPRSPRRPSAQPSALTESATEQGSKGEESEGWKRGRGAGRW
jgi:hypothetical protein